MSAHRRFGFKKKIVETYASDVGYRGILKQKNLDGRKKKNRTLDLSYKKSAKEKKYQTPQNLFNLQKLSWIKCYNCKKRSSSAFQSRSRGESFKHLISQDISKFNQVPLKMILRENQTSKIVSKPSNNSQIILKEILQNTLSEYFEKHTYQNIINIWKYCFVKKHSFLTIKKIFLQN